MIKTNLIIYFVGYVCTYFSYRACEKHFTKKWTKTQRIECLAFSFLSWAGFFVVFLYFILKIVPEKFGGDEPAKW